MELYLYKMTIAANQSIFKLDSPDFAWKKILVIPTDDDNENDDVRR